MPITIVLYIWAVGDDVVVLVTINYLQSLTSTLFFLKIRLTYLISDIGDKYYWSSDLRKSANVLYACIKPAPLVLHRFKTFMKRCDAFKPGAMEIYRLYWRRWILWIKWGGTTKRLNKSDAEICLLPYCEITTNDIIKYMSHAIIGEWISTAKK